MSVIIGNRTYPIIQIGGQTWLAQNLDYVWNGLSLSGSSTTSDQPSAWYKDGNSDYSLSGTYKCGLFYNYYAAKYLNDNRLQLLPSGWRVPVAEDYDALISYLGSSNAGTKMKALDGSVKDSFPYGWSGSNESGFNALPVGRGDGYGTTVTMFGSACYLGTISRRYNDPYHYRLFSSNTDVQKNWGYPYNGVTIRLIRD